MVWAVCTAAHLTPEMYLPMSHNGEAARVISTAIVLAIIAVMAPMSGDAFGQGRMLIAPYIPNIATMC